MDDSILSASSLHFDSLAGPYRELGSTVESSPDAVHITRWHSTIPTAMVDSRVILACNSELI